MRCRPEERCVLVGLRDEFFFASTRWGMFVRAVGDQPNAARAMGISVWKVRTAEHPFRQSSGRNPRSVPFTFVSRKLERGGFEPARCYDGCARHLCPLEPDRMPLGFSENHIGSAYGTRTRAPALRGPCPNRLDERAKWKEYRSSRSSGVQVEFRAVGLEHGS
jgi:hypothetical protein